MAGQEERSESGILIHQSRDESKIEKQRNEHSSETANLTPHGQRKTAALGDESLNSPSTYLTPQLGEQDEFFEVDQSEDEEMVLGTRSGRNGIEGQLSGGSQLLSERVLSMEEETKMLRELLVQKNNELVAARCAASSVTRKLLDSSVTRSAELPLPMAVQSHEMAYLPLANLIFITQQSSNSVLAVEPDPSGGCPLYVRKVQVPWEAGQGPHGLCVSTKFLGKLWCSLQFGNRLALVDIDIKEDGQFALRPLRYICMPAGVQGPHCLVEDGGALWVTCKDSSHLVHIKDCDHDMVVYPTSARPIFVAITESYVYSSLDLSSRIFCLNKVTHSSCEVSVEPVGRTPVGLVTGSDGHAWFVLLEGAAGMFGRLTGTEIQWLKLRSSCGGLIHLAFDGEKSFTSDGRETMKMWLLGSTMATTSSMDAVHTIQVEVSAAGAHVSQENTVALSTQGCGAHRLLLHRGGVFVSQLKTSSLAHITGAAVQGLGSNFLSDWYSLFGRGFSNNALDYLVASG